MRRHPRWQLCCLSAHFLRPSLGSTSPSTSNSSLSSCFHRQTSEFPRVLPSPIVSPETRSPWACLSSNSNYSHKPTCPGSPTNHSLFPQDLYCNYPRGQKQDASSGPDAQPSKCLVSPPFFLAASTPGLKERWSLSPPSPTSPHLSAWQMLGLHLQRSSPVALLSTSPHYSAWRTSFYILPGPQERTPRYPFILKPSMLSESPKHKFSYNIFNSFPTLLRAKSKHCRIAYLTWLQLSIQPDLQLGHTPRTPLTRMHRPRMFHKPTSSSSIFSVYSYC